MRRVADLDMVSLLEFGFRTSAQYRPLHVRAVIERLYIILHSVQKSKCTLKISDVIEHLILLNGNVIKMLKDVLKRIFNMLYTF